jgi:hypothetical protein
MKVKSLLSILGIDCGSCIALNRREIQTLKAAAEIADKARAMFHKELGTTAAEDTHVDCLLSDIKFNCKELTDDMKGTIVIPWK